MDKKFVWHLKFLFLTLFLLTEILSGIFSIVWFLEVESRSILPLTEQTIKTVWVLVILFFSAFCLFCFTRLEEK
ncbi:hypothetical protein DRO30_05750 [Candidatus Bathyarchaeota archaeon]|nr:MAG: hypothetical protein DRO30_05750 [Candidatus Bathyarchaeota archaeon]